jgi:hypothetical protein
MNSELMHSRVLDGPEVHLPIGNRKIVCAEELNFKRTMTRTQLERDILERLVTEVHETVATDVRFPNAKRTPGFGLLNLWNIRRNSRSARHAIKQPRIVTGFGF